MGYGLSFKGKNGEYVIGFGNAMQFHGKVTSYNALLQDYRPGFSCYLFARYAISVPSGKIPLIFTYSPPGEHWIPISITQISATLWYAFYRYVPSTMLNTTFTCQPTGSTAPNTLQLYVFVTRDEWPNTGWGIEVYNPDTTVAWNTDGPLPLLFNTYIEASITGRQIGVDSRYARVVYQPYGGATWAASGVAKPAWSAFNTGYHIDVINGYRRSHMDTYKLESTGLSIGMQTLDGASETIGKAVQINPAIIPIIDASLYD
jgi:hypothetical protein